MSDIAQVRKLIKQRDHREKAEPRLKARKAMSAAFDAMFEALCNVVVDANTSEVGLDDDQRAVEIMRSSAKAARRALKLAYRVRR